jgi:hypothetical protein
VSDEKPEFMPGAKKAVKGIEKLRWGFYVVVIAFALTVRIRPYAACMGAGIGFVILFFIYVYFISKLDCPHCERSLRYLWQVLERVTTCPFCGRRLVD